MKLATLLACAMLLACAGTDARESTSSSLRSQRGYSFATLPIRPAIPACAGSIASCPPCSFPMAHGLPTSSGSGVSVLFFPLRKVRPMG